MKRRILLVLILLATTFFVMAEEATATEVEYKTAENQAENKEAEKEKKTAQFEFLFEDLDQHSDILIGFCPTYIKIGAAYNGLELVKGNKTSISLTIGAGWLQRILWQDKTSGEVLSDAGIDDALKYNTFITSWTARFTQGFLKSLGGKKDFITLSAAYYGQFENAFDKSGPMTATIDSFLGDNYQGDVYPYLRGNRKFLSNYFVFSALFDNIEDTIHTNDGWWAMALLDLSPSFLNGALGGKADYYYLSLQGMYAKTLYNLKKGKKSMFSVVMIDRVIAEGIFGRQIPSYIEKFSSAARKLRGFDDYTYNTSFTCANNLEFRLTGPGLGIEDIAPRVNFFFDMGYAGGKYDNTDIKVSKFLSSLGFHAEICFFDIIDLGFQGTYLVSGEKYSQPGKFTWCFTFFFTF